LVEWAKLNTTNRNTIGRNSCQIKKHHPIYKPVRTAHRHSIIPPERKIGEYCTGDNSCLLYELYRAHKYTVCTKFRDVVKINLAVTYSKH